MMHQKKTETALLRLDTIASQFGYQNYMYKKSKLSEEYTKLERAQN